MEFFVPPDQSAKWYEYWVAERYRWHLDLGIPEDKLRIRPHEPDELSHYSNETSDLEFAYPWGWGELEGIANRGDYDLTQHQKFSGEDLSYFDQESSERYLPHVIEPALGADRSTLAFLLSAYDEDEAPTGEGKSEKRTVLRLDPRLAPVKVAVLPLSRNADLSPKARDIAAMLRKRWITEFDDAQAIGRRYRRQDEIGTPFCVTVDFDTLNDQAVTVRDRDTMLQERVAIAQVESYLTDRLGPC
jgi:glycyl-tRNA synthetase